ncbi:sulfurtransferase [Knoellia koreensis]|uniref:Sulfurtransferase n=1 Tax=Knoellia koreensis TaxID=2730921 RepID=A0A849HAX1_9MICO|nr:sulfurtransferase [Knoellia sp. DB2414S]NNM44558.1 sulfurtransferase [Knoellia sp. DB2414S]
MSALVSAEDLVAEGLDGLVVVDVQWNLTSAAGPPGRDLYTAGHLPGAHHVDLDAELAGPPGPGGRHPLPTAHAVQEAMRRCGVDAGSRVVVYDQGPSYAAARAWWVLRHFGLADVRVLDGGLTAWRAAGGPVTTEVPPPGDGTFEAAVDDSAGALLDADEAAKVARDGILLDARAPERFRGETEPIDPVAGHIPGAVNAPTTDNAGADGRFLAADQLRELFSRMGVRAGQRVGVYCGSGVTAAHEVLALHEAGVDAGLYVGSWSDWITDPTRPVATG